jgi:hypothetical protein
LREASLKGHGFSRAAKCLYRVLYQGTTSALPQNAAEVLVSEHDLKAALSEVEGCRKARKDDRVYRFCIRAWLQPCRKGRKKRTRGFSP